MEPTPHIVTITELRRDAARMFDSAAVDGSPVFVTQKGRLTAVVLSRSRYDELIALAAAGAMSAAGTAPRGGVSSATSSPAGTSPAASSSDPDSSRATSPGASPGGFPSTRPRYRVDTLYGPVDPETAAFFASEGIWTEDQGGPRPPWPWEERRRQPTEAAQPSVAATVEAEPKKDASQWRDGADAAARCPQPRSGSGPFETQSGDVVAEADAPVGEGDVHARLHVHREGLEAAADEVRLR